MAAENEVEKDVFIIVGVFAATLASCAAGAMGFSSNNFPRGSKLFFTSGTKGGSDGGKLFVTLGTIGGSDEGHYYFTLCTIGGYSGGQRAAGRGASSGAPASATTPILADYSSSGPTPGLCLM